MQCPDPVPALTPCPHRLLHTKREGSKAKASADPSNKALNRYNNIVAYDSSRVLVKPNKHNGKKDYINANWVPGFGQKRGYIASQGPVPDAFNAFWQMVWDTGVETIVMVTNEIENNKLKCHRYWPSREQPEETYGEIKVALLEEVPRSTFIERNFQISRGSAKFPPAVPAWVKEP